MFNTKIEKLGMGDTIIKFKAKGYGSHRISKALEKETGEKISPGVIDNYFKNIKRSIQKNKVLNERVATIVKTNQMKVLSNWEHMDKQLEELLDAAKAVQEKCIGVNKKTGMPIIVKEKDLRLWKDVLDSISKISEARAKVIGQINTAGGVHYHFTNIENQYNEMKQIILDLEGEFPGLGTRVEDKMFESGEKKF